MQDASAAVPLPCPSFSAYFADDMAQAAARVRRELAGDPESPTPWRNDDDFEFAALRPDPDLPSLSLFPIFNRNLSAKADDGNPVEHRVDDDKLEPLRMSLGNLFLDDRDPPSSSSSSEEEVDELEGVPSGTFCMWSPRRPANSSPSSCRKSNSTGSSSQNKKGWRWTDLILRRSKSDGKGLSSSSSSVFPNAMDSASDSAMKKRQDTPAEDTKRMKKTSPSPSPHELLYGRNGLKKDGQRRRTYLPYRKDLVGIFGNAHGLGRNIASL